MAPASLVSPRAVFGLMIPSTNTVVEAEFNWMRVPGISWHTGRILSNKPSLSTDEDFVAFLENLRLEIGNAVASVMTAEPTSIVMGMSAETFWGGKEGAAAFEKFMKELSGGLEITTGAAACRAALEVYGAKKIGIITPYQPVGDEQVVDFFTQLGFEVVSIYGFKCNSAQGIASVTPEQIKEAFRSVNGPDVDALIQAGTNLPAAIAAAELEVELGKPVIGVNTATVWHAYRSNGIKDQIKGFGSLLAEH